MNWGPGRMGDESEQMAPHPDSGPDPVGCYGCLAVAGCALGVLSAAVTLCQWLLG